jgi:hypothetical protein
VLVNWHMKATNRYGPRQTAVVWRRWEERLKLESVDMPEVRRPDSDSDNDSDEVKI